MVTSESDILDYNIWLDLNTQISNRFNILFDLDLRWYNTSYTYQPIFIKKNDFLNQNILKKIYDAITILVPFFCDQNGEELTVAEVFYRHKYFCPNVAGFTIQSKDEIKSFVLKTQQILLELTRIKVSEVYSQRMCSFTANRQSLETIKQSWIDENSFTDNSINPSSILYSNFYISIQCNSTYNKGVITNNYFTSNRLSRKIYIKNPSSFLCDCYIKSSTNYDSFFDFGIGLRQGEYTKVNVESFNGFLWLLQTFTTPLQIEETDLKYADSSNVSVSSVFSQGLRIQDIYFDFSNSLTTP